MSEIAIRAEKLGKRYLIGAQRAADRNFRELLTGMLATPFRRIGRLVSGKRATAGEFEELWALRDVSFEIKQGEVVGVIGRNGAGKSTLLKVLSRITEPTEGFAETRGRVGSLLEVGTGFHPELTGRENIFLNGAILGMKRVEIRAKFDEIVGFAGVEKFIDTPVKHYSSGMYLRLAFSVAAHMEPEILLVDEVLAVGDAEFQKRCLGKMDDVARSGRTVLFVSHNMGAIRRICGKVMQLDESRLIAFSADVDATIHAFLDSGITNRSEWRNDGSQLQNPWFVPLRMAVVDEAGRPARNPVANDDPLWLEIEGDVRRVDTALTIGYALYCGGELLYWSCQTDRSQDQWPVLTPGRLVLRTPLPTRFLNEGVYELKLIGGLHFKEWFFKPSDSEARIRLEIRGGLSDSPHWMERRPGLLAPVLPWELRPAGNGAQGPDMPREPQAEAAVDVEESGAAG